VYRHICINRTSFPSLTILCAFLLTDHVYLHQQRSFSACFCAHCVCVSASTEPHYPAVILCAFLLTVRVYLQQQHLIPITNHPLHASAHSSCVSASTAFQSCFLLWGGKEGNASCTVMPINWCRVWDSSTACRWVYFTRFCRLTYPLKPSSASVAWPYPFLSKLTTVPVLEEKSTSFPSGPEASLLSVPPDFIHETHRVPALIRSLKSSFSALLVSLFADHSLCVSAHRQCVSASTVSHSRR